MTRAEMEDVKKEFSNFQFASGQLDIRDLLGMSDIVIGIRSSGIFDALPYAMNKIITIRDRMKYNGVVHQKELFKQAAEMGETIMVDHEEELYQEVINYKRNVMYRKIPNSFWPNDAKEKFIELINSYFIKSKRLGDKRRKTQSII